MRRYVAPLHTNLYDHQHVELERAQLAQLRKRIPLCVTVVHWYKLDRASRSVLLCTKPLRAAAPLQTWSDGPNRPEVGNGVDTAIGQDEAQARDAEARLQADVEPCGTMAACRKTVEETPHTQSGVKQATYTAEALVLKPTACDSRAAVNEVNLSSKQFNCLFRIF